MGVLIPLQSSVQRDQFIGRGVVRQCRFALRLQFGDDGDGQDLAEFHTPLVEGVDAPDGPLGEDGVLVERDQRSEEARREDRPTI